jgi:PAS domain S-box-containing protein
MKNFDLSNFQSLALEAVQDAVVCINAATEVVFWNYGAEAMYDIPRKQAIGAPLSSLYHYEWLNPADEAQAFAALKTSKSWRGENRHITRSGKSMLVESSVSAVYQKGVEYGMMAIVRDITERKRIEQEHASLIEQLQKSIQKSKDLEELLTICAWTGRVKSGNEWISIETFLERVLGVQISHGISPDASSDLLRKKYGLDKDK